MRYEHIRIFLSILEKLHFLILASRGADKAFVLRVAYHQRPVE